MVCLPNNTRPKSEHTSVNDAWDVGSQSMGSKDGPCGPVAHIGLMSAGTAVILGGSRTVQASSAARQPFLCPRGALIVQPPNASHGPVGVMHILCRTAYQAALFAIIERMFVQEPTERRCSFPGCNRAHSAKGYAAATLSWKSHNEMLRALTPEAE
jgi:hypothetical protein